MAHGQPVQQLHFIIDEYTNNIDRHEILKPHFYIFEARRLILIISKPYELTEENRAHKNHTAAWKSSQGIRKILF